MSISMEEKEEEEEVDDDLTYKQVHLYVCYFCVSALPLKMNPSCLQATSAVSPSQLSSHTVPHTPVKWPTSCISPSERSSAYNYEK